MNVETDNRMYCTVCGKGYYSPAQMHDHLNGKLHRKKMEMVRTPKTLEVATSTPDLLRAICHLTRVQKNPPHHLTLVVEFMFESTTSLVPLARVKERFSRCCLGEMLSLLAPFP